MNYDGDLYQSVRSAAQVRGAELGVEQWNAKEIGKAAMQGCRNVDAVSPKSGISLRELLLSLRE